jgi:hypothetical protein
MCAFHQHKALLMVTKFLGSCGTNTDRKKCTEKKLAKTLGEIKFGGLGKHFYGTR